MRITRIFRNYRVGVNRDLGRQRSDPSGSARSLVAAGLRLLPPGRNGFQPRFNLVYSTGSGNGPFGLGWSLSVLGVTRKTSHGVPRYDDASDTFILWE